MKAAVLGAGFIGQMHIEALRRIPHTEIVAIADVGVAHGRAVAQKWGIPQFYTDYRKLLAESGAEVVHICTPNAQHFAMARDTVLAGRHLYCEKPLALTPAEADTLVALAQSAGVRCAVNYNYRHNVMVEEMKHRLADEGSGRILMVNGHYLQDWLLYETDFDWRLDPAIGGRSRAVADIGSHLFDLAQYVLGSRIVSVFAKLLVAHPVRRRRQKAGGTFAGCGGEVLEEVEVTNEDAAHVLARFENGVQASFTLSQVTAGHKNDLALHVDTDRCSYTWRQEESDLLRVGRRDEGNGTVFRGSATLGEPAQKIALTPVGHSEGWSEALKNTIACFYNSLRSGESDSRNAGIEQGAYIIHVIEACLASDDQNAWVPVTGTLPPAE